MAIKDWKKMGETKKSIGYVKKTKPSHFIDVFQSHGVWLVHGSNRGKDFFLGEFKTKSQALKKAYNYMRRN